MEEESSLRKVRSVEVSRRHSRSRRTFSSRLGAGLLACFMISTILPGQTPEAPKLPAQHEGISPSGMATGGVHPAQFDSEHRPITAGGIVKTGPVIFIDDAERAGLTTWHHTAGTPEKHFILEANAAGLAFLITITTAGSIFIL